MQVIGYSRVSTEDQARDGASLSAQEAKIEAYSLV
jgi:DNA invertase Pin-like site-specific DNA recombinase